MAMAGLVAWWHGGSDGMALVAWVGIGGNGGIDKGLEWQWWRWGAMREKVALVGLGSIGSVSHGGTVLGPAYINTY